MFAMRANKLYELYRAFDSLEAIPLAQRQTLEKSIFQMPLSDVWQRTHEFFSQRDPIQLQRAKDNPKHKMALVFRWYLGLSSRWANQGDPMRQVDYQIWCGPAMGAFNEWARGSALEDPANRRVVDVAENLLHGAAIVTRLNQLRCQGVQLPSEFARVEPRLQAELQ
jgi:PfaD family protein